ncbi:MAG: hypothetical protein JO170_27890 [Verrucomicrobia bacterium]|nr:hypothetical protein [Verrucomicrobiota bacterium]
MIGEIGNRETRGNGATTYSELVWKKNAELADLSGWVFSIIAGRFEVIADSQAPPQHLVCALERRKTFAKKRGSRFSLFFHLEVLNRRDKDAITLLFERGLGCPQKDHLWL